MSVAIAGMWVRPGIVFRVTFPRAATRSNVVENQIFRIQRILGCRLYGDATRSRIRLAIGHPLNRLGPLRTLSFSNNTSLTTKDGNDDNSGQLRASNLERPTVLYQSNHLLAVNKPAGWHSIPNDPSGSTDEGGDDKCLLTYLMKERCGGGSNNSFLLPMHRLDQPCSGVVLLAKTKRAASRIQTRWAARSLSQKEPLKTVQKSYICVIDPRLSNLALLQKYSRPSENGWWNLAGYHRKESPRTPLKPKREKKRRNTRKQSYEEDPTMNTTKGWSVVMDPVSDSSSAADETSNDAIDTEDHVRPLGRLCRISWKPIRAHDDSPLVLYIHTLDGARHMIRALLRMAKNSIAGDLRYGAWEPLVPDRSVALHTRRIQLPDDIPLGDESHNRDFVAPIPTIWQDYFGLEEDMIHRWEASELEIESPLTKRQQKIDEWSIS